MSYRTFVPALRYKRLTKFFDFFLMLTFPERRIKQALMTELNLAGNETILDFGSGTGTLAIMIKEKYPESKITGVDVDEKINSIAERKIRSKGLLIPIITYDGIRIPFVGNTQFNKIISSLVFHHIPTTAKAPLIKQLYEITEPGGEIVIADFGKPRTIYTKIAFGFFRRFDGKDNTQVNRDGRLPEFMANSGFSKVRVVSHFNTAFGTIDLIKGTKP